jgi:protein-disulfide isomerase
VNTQQPHLTLPVGERDHVQGPADAPVTLVEYGDYECPYCGRAYPIVKALQARLGDRLRFVFRNFPLTTAHPHAERAAEAAEAAAAHGRFWEMHDRLYEHQRALDDSHLERYAADVGLDVARFTGELEAGHHRARVREDFLSGVRSGVNGTPTFFINGVRHDDSYAPEVLLAALERAAAGEGHAPPGATPERTPGPAAVAPGAGGGRSG